MAATRVAVDSLPNSAKYKSPRKTARDAASQTASEYGEASSLHGIQASFHTRHPVNFDPNPSAPFICYMLF